MSSEAIENLRQALEATLQAAKWLRRSYDMVSSPPFGELDKSDWDTLEALSSRFARLSDLLLQKLYRAIDRVELQLPGSLIDVVNRAEKRGLVDDVNGIRDMRDLRNEIAHEYKIDDLLAHYEEIYQMTPELLEMVKRAEGYIRI